MTTKFITELEPAQNPDDAAEMARHVFGSGAGAGPGGTHIEQGLCSEWSIRHGKTPTSTLIQHLEAVRRTSGLEAYDAERAKVRKWQREGGVPVTV